MNILLVAVNAKYIHSNLAVYSLKAYAETVVQAEIEIAEYTINQYVDDILQEIYARKPDMLAFSCYIWNITVVEQLIRELYKLLPGVPIWVGGPEVSYRAKAMLEQFPQLTGVMRGEGERIFANVVKAYTKEIRDFSEILGITYRNKQQIVETPPEAELDMDTLPFVYQNLGDFENKILYYESSRGCPFSCSYCLSSIDKRLRFRSLKLVKQELQFFLAHRVPQVKFVDRTFNCDRQRALEIWRYLFEHDNGVTNFHFEVAADLLTEEQIQLIRRMRPGLIQLEIGVQSTNAHTIMEIHRSMDLKQVQAVVSKVNAGSNVHQHLDLIAGLPYEDLNSFQQSFNAVYAMEPEQLQLGFLKVLSGSYMHTHKEEYGLVCQDRPPYEVLYTKWLSYEDICMLKKVETVLELYYNSGQFRCTMQCLVRKFETPYHCYEALGVFYEAGRKNGEKHNRLTQYKILLAFIQKVLEKQSEAVQRESQVFQELLTLDVYLRDNSKTRPEFAPDLSLRKDAIYNFYKQEEQQRRYLPDYEGYHYKQLVKMTHLERFSCNLFDFIRDGSITEEPIWLLFDYQNRNPLNQEARTVLIKHLGMED